MHTHDDTSELPEKIHDLARALEPTLEMLHNQLQRNWSTIQHSIDIRPVLIHSLTRYQWHLKHLRSLIEDIETKILRAPNPDDWVIEQCCSRLHHETRELLRDYHQLCTYVVYAANIGPHHALCDVYRYTASQLLRLLQDINILASTGVAPTGSRTHKPSSIQLFIDLTAPTQVQEIQTWLDTYRTPPRQSQAPQRYSRPAKDASPGFNIFSALGYAATIGFFASLFADDDDE